MKETLVKVLDVLLASAVVDEHKWSAGEREAYRRLVRVLRGR